MSIKQHFEDYKTVHHFFYDHPLKQWVCEDNFYNHFFDDWNVLMPVVQKCFDTQTFGSNNLVGDITHALVDVDIEKTFNAVLSFVIFYNNQGAQKKQNLFEYYKELPENVNAIIASFDENKDSYKECERLLSELKPLGYCFEYELSGEPFNLHQIDL